MIDFDYLSGNLKSLFNKKIEFEKIEESELENYKLKINDNIDIIIGLDILYFYKKINEEKIKKYIEKNKDKYDYIVIDTITENNEIKIKILDICEKIIFLSGINNLEINKTKENLKIIKKNNKLENFKIDIILYKYNVSEFINIRKFKYLFIDYKIIGKFKNINLINYLYKNKFKNTYLYNFKIKKIANKI